VTIVASPVEGSSVIFWVSPIDIDGRVVGEEILHKVQVSGGAGVPQLLLLE